MSAEGHIVERMKTAEMARKGKYEEYRLPKEVLKITRNDEGKIIETAKQPEIRKVVTMPPRPGLEAGRRKNGEGIVKKPKETRIIMTTGPLKSDLSKSIDLLKEDISISKKLDTIYYVEMSVGGIILVSTILVYHAGGLKAIPMIIPMIILGLGIFFTSFAAKRRIKRVRKEHGI